MEENEREVKRICESRWHEETELEPFQKCPICSSQSHHSVKVIKLKNE